MNKRKLHVGIDIGSTTTKIVVMDPAKIKFYIPITDATVPGRWRVWSAA